MADSVIQTPASRSSAAPSVNRGPASTLLHGILGFAIWLVLGLFGNILIEWLCMGVLWPEQGTRRSEQLFVAEIGYLENDLQDSLLTEHPTRFAVAMAKEMNRLVFDKTGLTKAIAFTGQHQTQPTKHETTRFRQLITQFYATAHNYLIAAMVATQVYALRLSVLCLSIPVFVLAGLVGAIDGIVQRDLNRWRGGRELGQRYHLAKSFVAPALTLPWIVYLAWPTPIHPYLIILPFAGFLGWVMSIMTARFKKYF
jgi:integrating conjugative element membrane protein (TIGR03747 family)